MKKIKEFSKKYLIGFIFGVLSAGIISAYAATYFPSNQTTYDNTNSELKSENVQDAIDELYGVCFPPKAGDTILDNTDIVTSGDGLYEDEYEDGRYFYKGANPNNYVTFNNEQAGWRIVSIEPDGTIKIMRTASIEGKKWDISGSNNWARPASLNTYLNGTYYNGLNATAKSQIVAKDWSIGAVTDNNNNMSAQISNENSKLWKGNIALPTMSEYLRTNSDINKCKTFRLYRNNYNNCKNTTWMYISFENWWTLSPYNNNSVNILGVSSNGYIGIDNAVSDTGRLGVHPTLYLSSDIKITGGTGTKSDPYEISL